MAETVLTTKKFAVEKVVEQGDPTYYVTTPDAAGVICIDEQNRILLTREFRPKSQAYHWRIPAGRSEPGEDLMACAQRELREESGFDARSIEPFFDYEDLASWSKQRKAFFIARDLFPAPLDTGDEPLKPEVHFLSPENVLELLNSGEIVGDIAAALYRALHNFRLLKAA